MVKAFAPTREAELLGAFQAYEGRERIHNTKVGCFLVVALMPAGVSLDYFAYPKHLWWFFQARLVCAALAGIIWGLLYTESGRKANRWLSVIVPMLPAVFIAWMIAVTDGFHSPYYAGLNLVLLAVGAVLRWTPLESLVAVLLALVIYIIAGLWRTPVPYQSGLVFNNFYFIALMDVIVVVGTYFQHQARFTEFALRHELDSNRHTLEEANRKLVELDQVKSRFFANISHELRTPLTLLLAPLETLLHQYGHTFDEQTRDWLRTMQTNGMRLLKLINDLLDLVRLESGKLQVRREAVAVDEFILGLANSVRKVADDKRVHLGTFVSESIGQVNVDRDKLEKIVLNLLFNAIKFTPAGGRVELRAGREQTDLVVRVIDTGMGISAENLPHIFDRFWQADTSSRRKYQGTGIGLALVKELAEAQDGKVSVSSEPGQGTTMTIRIPCPEGEVSEPAEPAQLAPAPAGNEASAAVQAPDAKLNEWLAGLYRRAEMFPSMTPLQESLRPMETNENFNRPRVLIADDEPDMLRFLKSQLTAQFQVLEAVDGQQAVEKASQFLPDLILCDMMMPEKDGLQVCRELRARLTTQNIPIVVLTARADEETKMAALAAGASDFLTKPFSTTELHVRLKNLFDNHQLQRTLAKQNQILEATIEQLKDTETQLVQSEKMAALGRMSAGIIHEINNPLNYAKTGIYTLKHLGGDRSAEARAQYEDILKDVEEGIDRVKTIVSDLRGFTHPSGDQFDYVELDPVVDGALRFVSNELKDGIQVQKQIPPGLTAWANQNKLVQVLVNLLQNSADALKGRATADEPPTIWIEGRAGQGKIQLAVRDNGPGVPEELRNKIFDPFFTTKDVGEGMGLGLSICYRIMEEHEGRILLRSEPGRGCEFTLEFPEKVQQSTAGEAST